MSNNQDKKLNFTIFILSLITLIISIKLFWNLGIYADEYGSSPVKVNGGYFWLTMNWLRSALLIVLVILSAKSITKNKF